MDEVEAAAEAAEAKAAAMAADVVADTENDVVLVRRQMSIRMHSHGRLLPADKQPTHIAGAAHVPQMEIAPGARTDIARTHYDQAQLDDILESVNEAIGAADDRLAHKEHEELMSRHMVKSNYQTTLRVVVHEGLVAERHFLMDVTRSISLPELKKAVRLRCGEALPSSLDFQLSWLRHGEPIALDLPTWREYVFAEWCEQPWVVHAHTISSEARSAASELAISLTKTAEHLFERYDVNHNGRVERRELARLLRDLRLERLDCPPELVERFIEGEFRRLDVDGSEGLELAEFSEYRSLLIPSDPF